MLLQTILIPHQCQWHCWQTGWSCPWYHWKLSPRLLAKVFIFRSWSGTGLDPDSIGSVDPYPGRQKVTKNKKIYSFAGCSHWGARAFSCSLKALYGDMRIKKNTFFVLDPILIFFKFFLFLFEPSKAWIRIWKHCQWQTHYGCHWQRRQIILPMTNPPPASLTKTINNTVSDKPTAGVVDKNDKLHCREQTYRWCRWQRRQITLSMTNPPPLSLTKTSLMKTFTAFCTMRCTFCEKN
jgi:hypothetical protein